ncbi:Histidine kinase [Lentibacillus sp. JNUCC-1]|uniref:MEDS domain-containing protein n=1 Tax=Lentibacillus sp. JNUCC-1 TaxID=2654513 RepID=UPI0012E79575|nr:MEDS domain-containing protein [Lentibacillus sp. JNUCC-1]MUV37798.1 Histidine kinase [Lentibacillus sp. JNUCC-1]
MAESPSKEIKVEFLSDVTIGNHIVYTFNNMEKYLENATSYIAEGIDQNQFNIHIGYPEHFDVIKHKLEEAGYSRDQVQHVIFGDSDTFYGIDEAFNVKAISQNAGEILEPLFQEHRPIRAWGLVKWKPQDPKVLTQNLTLYEQEYDTLISQKEQIMSLCAYDEKTLPSELMNELLKTHEYHMTDTHLTYSHLYQKKPVQTPFISEQIELLNSEESEKINYEKLHLAGTWPQISPTYFAIRLRL